MLTKRIISCLDIKDGRTVKGVNFEALKDAGSPVELAKRYVAEGADELVFLDITATLEKRKTLLPLVREVARSISIPFTVGGGIRNIEDARELLWAGADKVSLNSQAVRHPESIAKLAEEFGSQAVVVAIDVKTIDGVPLVHIDAGKTRTDFEVLNWVDEVASLGAGEILLTSMDHDGTKAGYPIDLLARVAGSTSLPVIASGGAGEISHFVEVFRETDVSAALAASVFHFEEIRIRELKAECAKAGVEVRI